MKLNSDNFILTTKDLVIGYDEPLISDLNLKITPGKITSIIGPSGIGKTTLLRTLSGLVMPLSGSIECNVPRRGGLGYIPQRLGLVRHTSVYHNVDLGARAGTRFLSEPKTWLKRRNDRVLSAIETMGLSDKIDEPIRRLSGGQQRRVATARTLAQQPGLILADEFLSELDDSNISLVINAVKEYLLESKSAMIVVEHNVQRAVEISDEVLQISDGKLRPYVNSDSDREEE
jgi:ABC-type multidrug transport system ATPase subunit